MIFVVAATRAEAVDFLSDKQLDPRKMDVKIVTNMTPTIYGHIFEQTDRVYVLSSAPEDVIQGVVDMAARNGFKLGAR